MAVTGGGNLGGASFEISGDAGSFFETLKRIDAAVNATAANINKAFERAGIGGSPGLEKVREDLEQIGVTAEQVGEAANELRREFGKPIEFVDPGSLDRIFVGIREATRLLVGYEQELTRIDQIARERELLPDVAARREELVTTIQTIRDQLGRLRVESQDAFNLPNVSRTQKEVQGLAKIQEAAIRENQRFDESLQLKNAGLPELSQGQRAIQQFGAIQEKAIQENLRFDESLRLKNVGVPQLAANEKTLQNFGKLQAAAIQENLRFDESLRLKNAGLPELTQGQRAIQQFGAIQERAIQGNLKFDESLRLKNAGIPQLAANEKAVQNFGKIQAAAIAENKKFDRQVELSKGTFGGLRRALDGVNNTFQKFGLTIRDVSIILGSGLLSGGIALIAREVLQLVQAGIQAAINLAKLGSEVLHLRSQIDAAFGPASEKVREFARSTAEGFGLSEKAALTLTGQIGLLFQSFGTTKQASADFALQLVEIARVLQRTSPGAGSLSEVISGLKAAIGGSIESLRQYGIEVNDVTLRNVAAQHGFAGVSSELTASEKALLTFIFANDQAIRRLDEMANVSESAAEKQAELAATAENLRIKLGEELDPIWRKVLEGLTSMTEGLKRGIESFKEFNQENPEFLEGLKTIVGFSFRRWASDLKVAAKVVAEFIRASKPLVDLLIAANEVLTRFGGEESAGDKFKEFVGTLTNEQQATVKLLDKLHLLTKARKEELLALENVNKATRNAVFSALKAAADEEASAAQRKAAIEANQKAEEAFRREREKNQELLKKDPEFLQRAQDAQEALNRARIDGELRVQEALERLARTREDNAQKLNELTIRNERAAVDAAIRVNEAEQQLEDARESRRRRLEDAQEKVDDAQRQASRANRTVQERIEDFQRESSRRIINLKAKVSEAHKKEARDFTEALVSIETAQRHGDAEAENAARRELARAKASEDTNDTLAEAEKNLAEQQKDDAIELARLQRDLKESREDGARAVARAVRDQQRAERDGLREVQKAQDGVTAAVLAQNRAHQDAIRSLGELEVQMNRALFDAKKGVRDAERDRDRAIESATKAFQKLADQIGSTIEQLITLLQVFKRQQEAAIFFAATQPFAHFQAGGPIPAKQLALVGERGPELFVPDQSGTVISNKDLKKLLAQLGNGGTQQITVNEVANDPEATAFAVAARLVRGVG